MKKLLNATSVMLCMLCSGCSGQTSKAFEIVTPCQVAVPRELRETTFIVVYRFDVSNSGRTQNVRKVKNDYLPDEPFLSCIGDWNLPDVRGEASATFFRKTAEGGWTELVVSAKGFHKTYHYDKR
jgi:hypothetical protein